MTTFSPPSHIDEVDRDTYRFGDGPTPVLQPGTLGWSADDLNDPVVERLWLDGRYEILDGVLVTLPPTPFLHGSCVLAVQFTLRDHLKSRDVRLASASGGINIRVGDRRLLRADAVSVIGEDLPRFHRQRFPMPRPKWQQRPIVIPPTLVIESVSDGHGHHDQQTKRRWYAEFGVPNYWIVDAFARTLDCLRLDGTAYREAGVGRDSDVVRPTAFDGLSIPLVDIWQDDDDEPAAEPPTA